MSLWSDYKLCMTSVLLIIQLIILLGWVFCNIRCVKLVDCVIQVLSTLPFCVYVFHQFTEVLKSSVVLVGLFLLSSFSFCFKYFEELLFRVFTFSIALSSWLIDISVILKCLFHHILFLECTFSDIDIAASVFSWLMCTCFLFFCPCIFNPCLCKFIYWQIVYGLVMIFCSVWKKFLEILGSLCVV